MSTTEQAPMTWPQIRDALEAIAPTVSEDGPVDARALARTMAVAAQRRWNRNLSRYFAGRDEATRRLFTESVNALCAEFAMIHLLMAFADENPVRAGELATQIRDAWDDGGSIGEWLWQHEQALGIDADAVNRLEDAWQALPETVPGEEPAP